MTDNNTERQRNNASARILEGIFIAVVAGVLVYIITTGKIPWPPSWLVEQKESWVKIQSASVTPSSDGSDSVVVDLDVRYSLGEKDSALLAVMCNYAQQDSFTSMGLDGETIIDHGDGAHSFRVSFILPEWDEVSIRAYIHPYPLPDQWEPIAVSEIIELPIEGYR